MKMTFQPKKRQRAKVHGFRSRMSTAGGIRERSAADEEDISCIHGCKRNHGIFTGCADRYFYIASFKKF